MKLSRIRWVKVAWAGVLATVVGFVVGFLLYGAANGAYARFGELAYARPVESVGTYLAQMVVGGLALNLLLALVYAVVQEALPGQKRWQQGFSFGLILLVVNMLPIAFNTWIQISQPEVLILIEALNRSIGLLITALIIAVVYGRPDVEGRMQQATAG
jgi:hypothetical protein